MASDEDGARRIDEAAPYNNLSPKSEAPLLRLSARSGEDPNRRDGLRISSAEREDAAHELVGVERRRQSGVDGAALPGSRTARRTRTGEGGTGEAARTAKRDRALKGLDEGQEVPMKKLSALRYYGGKNAQHRTGRWIASMLPYDKGYVEPFAGMLGVLLQRRRSAAEMVNDADGNLIDGGGRCGIIRRSSGGLSATLPTARTNTNAGRRLGTRRIRRPAAKGARLPNLHRAGVRLRHRKQRLEGKHYARRRRSPSAERRQAETDSLARQEDGRRRNPQHGRHGVSRQAVQAFQTGCLLRSALRQVVGRLRLRNFGTGPGCVDGRAEEVQGLRRRVGIQGRLGSSWMAQIRTGRCDSSYRVHRKKSQANRSTMDEQSLPPNVPRRSLL